MYQSLHHQEVGERWWDEPLKINKEVDTKVSKGLSIANFQHFHKHTENMLLFLHTSSPYPKV